MSNGIYPKAVWLPGPANKQSYEWPDKLTERTGRGALVHSMEGLWQSAIARLDSTAQVSWHFSITYDGIVLQSYPLSAVCWHGGFYANCRWAGIECEGRAGEVLTIPQTTALIELLWWMAHEEGWPYFKHERETGTLLEHRWYCATECPSGRIPFAYIIERLNAMATELDVLRLTMKLAGLAIAGQWQELANVLAYIGVKAG